MFCVPGPERMDNAVSLHAAAEGSRRVWVPPHPRPHEGERRVRPFPGRPYLPPGLASVGTGPSEGPGHRAPRHERLLPRRAKRDDNLRRSKLERRGAAAGQNCPCGTCACVLRGRLNYLPLFPLQRGPTDRNYMSLSFTARWTLGTPSMCVGPLYPDCRHV